MIQELTVPRTYSRSHSLAHGESKSRTCSSESNRSLRSVSSNVSSSSSSATSQQSYSSVETTSQQSNSANVNKSKKLSKKRNTIDSDLLTYFICRRP
ncbi:osteocalcin 2-like [Macrobrachium nipponense]|uniref:osteocalcin 2-like n=1 Tax=Macrobrachium nipponense TaxID=159736 RepID=UPI0030C80915